jgi:hypothetical protein
VAERPPRIEALPSDLVVEPDALATWLHVDPPWVTDAITRGLPVLGRRSDGTPLFAVGEVRAWLRQPSVEDDAT